MVDPRAVARHQLWWSAKVLPLAAVAALSALASNAAPGPTLPRLAALLVSAAGLGAFAHLINDWADIETDELAAKPNQLALLGPAFRSVLVLASLAIGLAPWVLLGLPRVLWILLAVLVALPLVYSARPIRLKGRATAGVLADALQAHVVPVVFTMLLAATGAERTTTWKLSFAAATVWACAFGVRSILVHQLSDEPADRAARVHTFVVRHGPVRALVIGRRVFGVEVVGLAGLWIIVATLAPVAAAFLAAYLLVWVLNLKWDHRPFNPTPRQAGAWMPLSEFYEVWPALALTLALTHRDTGWWPLPVAVAVLFTGAIVKQTVDLWHLLVPIGRDLIEVGRTIVDARPDIPAIARSVWWACRRAIWRMRARLRSWRGVAAGKLNSMWWVVRDVPWRLRVLWYDGWLGRARYGAKRGVTRAWLFLRRQGRRLRRVVLRRAVPGT